MGLRVCREKEVLKKYAKDHSPCRRVLPAGVVFPENSYEVSEIIRNALSGNHTISVRGGGSGVNGGCIPSSDKEIVMSLENMCDIRIEKNNLMGWAQSGANTLIFQKKCEENGLFFPPDPSSADISTIGGNLACNAGGMRGFRYGTFRDYVLELEFVDGMGNIVHTGKKTFKWVSGLDLVRLLTGSEGILGVITSAWFKLLPYPAYKRTYAAYFSDISSLMFFYRELLFTGVIPSNAEFLDRHTARLINADSSGRSLLLLEFDSYDEAQLDNNIDKVRRCLKPYSTSLKDIDEDNSVTLWKARKNLRNELEKIRPFVFSEDFVLPFNEIPGFIDFCDRVCSREKLFYVNFGHISDGNIHFSSCYSDESEKERIEKVIDILVEYIIERGGSIAGEHGIGKYKRKYLETEIGSQNMEYIRQIKKIFDPQNIINPGKVL